MTSRLVSGLMYFASITWFSPLCPAQDTPTPGLGYNRDIRPILADKCFRCHGSDRQHREGELRLDRREDATAMRDGQPAIAPGDAPSSELVRRTAATAPDDERMPPPRSGLKLTPREISTLRQWIAEGAAYEPHWSFLPPQGGSLPAVRDTSWPRNAVDRFVLAGLERLGRAPSAPAAREALLRRVSLDLTGLPPTIEELDHFLADTSDDAYERVVDRLLESPRFGERLALEWMDVARYADTNGYYTDSHRHSWPWRDWVINAFNSNMPFDRFTFEQLAGDLLPQATLDQKVATGFNRNHTVTNESGSIDEEFRTGYVFDRVETTSTVWLGLTVGCARCHDHKYDPITQRDFFRLFAYFNQVDEKGVVKDAVNPGPVLPLPTALQERDLATLKSGIASKESRVTELTSLLKGAQTQWETIAAETLPDVPSAGCEVHLALDGPPVDLGPRQLAVSVQGSFRTSPGVLGQAGEFDATQWLEFDNSTSLDGSRPFSVCVWVKPGTAPSGCVVSRMTPDADARGFEIIWYKSQPRINLVHQWGRNALEVVATEKFPTGEWRHLAVTYDGSRGSEGLKLYVDGQVRDQLVLRETLTGSTDCDEPWRLAWKATGVGFEGGLDEFRLFDRVLDAEEVMRLSTREMLQGCLASPAAARTKQQAARLQQAFLSEHGSPELKMLVSDLGRLRVEELAIREQMIAMPVMRDLPKPRETFILTRGQYDQPSEPVTPGIPAALGQISPESPRDRRGFAQWLVDPANPLTGRVIVNRYWQMLFGEGLVRTPNDFGLQGDPPTHPELLDWVARDFVDSGWNVKRLFRQIVTSSTYRQSSDFTPGLLSNDPDNRLLARGPRYRLPAELLRDQALAVGGLLAERLGGRSVSPYQPTGLWEAVSYNGVTAYEQDHGEALYRRGLYTFWKRQSPPPVPLAFDGPTREVCTVRRARTNTPLQALALLNDVTFLEASRGLATQILRAGGTTSADRTTYAFRRAVGREPTTAESRALQRLVAEQLTSFQTRPQAAQSILQHGESPVDQQLPSNELAAWTIAASVLLNLDEFMTQH